MSSNPDLRETHPSSYTMDTGCFRGVKQTRRGFDQPPPSMAEVKEIVELYIYSHSGSSSPVLGWILPLPLPARVTCDVHPHFLIILFHYVNSSYSPLVKGKVLPVHTMNAFRMSRGTAPPILNLDTKWRWVVSVTPQRQRLDGTTVGLVVSEVARALCLCRDSNSGSCRP